LLLSCSRHLTCSQITDAAGNFQYIPFPTCTESSSPLSFHFLPSGPQNCTISLSDALFHEYEFYLHHDTPLSCRIPVAHLIDPKTNPAAAEKGADHIGDDALTHVPLVFALSGTLQKSHLHVANQMNVVLHTSAGPIEKNAKGNGAIDSAVAYSVSPETVNQRIVIGDELTFRMHVNWYTGTKLPNAAASNPSSGRGMGMLLFGVMIGALLCYVLLRGLQMPSAVKGFGGGRKEVLPKYNGYGYGVGMNGHSGGGGFGLSKSD